MGKFLKECYIQKTNRYGALEVWKELGMGEELTLAYDKKEINIEVKYKDNVLGILSDEDAKALTVFFDAGWNNPKTVNSILFKGRISKFDSNADENKRLEIAIFVRDANEQENLDKKVEQHQKSEVYQKVKKSSTSVRVAKNK